MNAKTDLALIFVVGIGMAIAGVATERFLIVGLGLILVVVALLLGSMYSFSMKLATPRKSKRKR